MRQLVHAVLFVALAAGVFGLLPRLGEPASQAPSALTPGALGVMEVTLAAISVGFGAPRAAAGLAVLGCRVVNYWLPLLPGAVAYLRLRLSLKAADAAEPSAPRPGE